ncbi:hypothetical protein P692DRAFT_20837570 [Suillus brevipes Sb2]|nr:hypothetical protein P692DRAFT_20837570 [Suillus brevipes Sb2]
MYGVKDKIFGPSLPTEVEPFDLLSFRSLKLTGSVGHSGNSLLQTLGRAAAFLEILDVMYMAIRPFTSYPAGKTSQPHLHCTYLSTLRKLVIIPSYLQSIPPDIMPLLTFDSTGERLRFLMIHRLDPCRSLQYYPALKTFIYVSPTNPNI